MSGEFLIGSHCPRCNATLLHDDAGKVWCSFIGGRNEKPCTYGIDAPRTLVPQPDPPSDNGWPPPLNIPDTPENRKRSDHALSAYTGGAVGIRNDGEAHPAPAPQRTDAGEVAGKFRNWPVCAHFWPSGGECLYCNARRPAPAATATSPSDDYSSASLSELLGCIQAGLAVDACTREIAKRVDAAQFNKRRVGLLAELQSRMRDPERTIVCDIIANGDLLPDPLGKRYGQPATATSPAVDEGMLGVGLENLIVGALNDLEAVERCGNREAAQYIRAAILATHEIVRRGESPAPARVSAGLSAEARETILNALTWYVPATGDAPDECIAKVRADVANARAEIEAMP